MIANQKSKQIVILGLHLLLTGAFFCRGQGVPTVAEINLLLNGDFEPREENGLAGWRGLEGCAIDSSHAYRGHSSLRISGSSKAQYATAELRQALNPGCEYVLRYHVDARRIAIGEGAKNISWFIFKTQQWWIGIEDNLAIWDELGRLADRLTPIRAILPNLNRIEDRFQVASDGPHPYGATHARDDGRIYLVVHNGDGHHEREISISSAHYASGHFVNMETPSEVIRMGDSITLQPGDGALLRFFEQ